MRNLDFRPVKKRFIEKQLSRRLTWNNKYTMFVVKMTV